MAITDPLHSRWYQCGWLLQQCDACDWAQRGHKIELVECPACGVQLGNQVAIDFGGLFVSVRRSGFSVINSCGGKAIIQENDVPETIKFLCRHGKDIRAGQDGLPSLLYPSHIRRVPNKGDIRDHFQDPAY